MQWNDDYLLGNEKIDSQHKILFGFINKLEALIDAKACHFESVLELLNDLTNYTIYHFETEEKLLRAADYPDIDAHLKEHSLYVEDAIDLMVKGIGGEVEVTAILAFLKHWWGNHILKEDFAYRKYLGNAGIPEEISQIKWQEEYAIGYELIDVQHKALFETIAKLEKMAKKDDDDREGIVTVLDEITQYAVSHFRTEELLMKEMVFPDIEGHIDQHFLFTAKCMKFMQDALDGTLNLNDLVSFMKDWWIKHVLHEDLAYREYLPNIYR